MWWGLWLKDSFLVLSLKQSPDYHIILSKVYFSEATKNMLSLH